MQGGIIRFLEQGGSRFRALGRVSRISVNLKSLKIFCDIVTRRSFSRAAEDNGISQSGASQVVSQLESANLPVQENE